MLLVALDNLGDLIFASALAPALRAGFPSATLDVWCKAYTADIARLIPGVNEVIAADPFWAVHPQHERPPMMPFIRSAMAIRRGHYELAVLSEAPWRAAAAVATTRIPVRIGSARHRNSVFLTDVIAAEDPRKPVVAEQARLLAPLGVAPHDLRYRLEADRLEPVRRELSERLPRRFAAVHPFASLPRKRADFREWLPLADALEARGLATLWIGTPAELEMLRAVRASALCIDRVRDSSLTSTAAALSMASLFAGHDSGPMHLAGALGCSVVAAFVTGTPERYGPQGVGLSRTLYFASPGEFRIDAVIREVDALAPALATR